MTFFDQGIRDVGILAAIAVTRERSIDRHKSSGQTTGAQFGPDKTRNKFEGASVTSAESDPSRN
ncbi:hypothetical protein [Phyllobacterium sp. SB3]|uniref:hypothetical protein n=1 Tax=Phyllobacterium sp. SB3 TaxID=3156073 RepID=UPI0032AFA075